MERSRIIIIIIIIIETLAVPTTTGLGACVVPIH
jgi:hypothetical protein